MTLPDHDPKDNNSEIDDSEYEESDGETLTSNDDDDDNNESDDEGDVFNHVFGVRRIAQDGEMAYLTRRIAEIPDGVKARLLALLKVYGEDEEEEDPSIQTQLRELCGEKMRNSLEEGEFFSIQDVLYDICQECPACVHLLSQIQIEGGEQERQVVDGIFQEMYETAQEWVYDDTLMLESMFTVPF